MNENHMSLGPGHRNLLSDWLIDVGVLGVATIGTYVALDVERPRTAVLIYLLGVLLIGARSGLYRGIGAALVASFIYNFFLSEPVFRLGVSSLDELVPLVAFNISAIVSGGLAGRLKDRANAARAAEAKNAVLLRLSDRLQRAITPSDVTAIAREALAAHGIKGLNIVLSKENGRSLAEGRSWPAQLKRPYPGRDGRDNAKPERIVFDLTGSTGELGTASFAIDRQAGGGGDLLDLKAVANLLALAIDRCRLLEQVSENQAAQRSEELKSAILSSVSHDLRTPLTAIEAAATSLRGFRSTLTAEQEEEMLTTIADQCARLNRYTANLLDMGRIQTGIADTQMASVDLVEILGVALVAIRRRFPAQEICKEIPISSAVVSANAAMLEQTIFNILENAVVHGGAGKPILVRLTLDRACCYLEVIDNGPGVPPQEQSRVFERFYRGAPPGQRDGSGLGLYIARGFVEAFGGTVRLQSPVIENTGTTVTVRLPLQAERTDVQEIGDAHSDR